MGQLADCATANDYAVVVEIGAMPVLVRTGSPEDPAIPTATPHNLPARSC